VLDEKRTNGWIEQNYDPTTGLPGPIRRHPGEGGTFFKNEICVEIRAPGEKDFIVRRQLRPSDKYRFPIQWKAFEDSEKGMAPGQDGTPLDLLPFLTKAQVMEFQAVGITTAEHLADTSDVNGQKFMDFQRVRRRAQDFVEAAKGNAPILAIRAENDDLRSQLVAMQKQIKELAERKK